jgi:hypothetical protein
MTSEEKEVRRYWRAMARRFHPRDRKAQKAYFERYMGIVAKLQKLFGWEYGK